NGRGESSSASAHGRGGSGKGAAMKSKSGFTLVEMALTVGVLGLGLSILFALLPAAASSSRSHRDRQRVEVCADRVFATLEWSLHGPVEGLPSPDPDLVLALPSVAGPQLLQETEDEILVPELVIENEVLPKLYY